MTKQRFDPRIATILRMAGNIAAGGLEMIMKAIAKDPEHIQDHLDTLAEVSVKLAQKIVDQVESK